VEEVFNFSLNIATENTYSLQCHQWTYMNIIREEAASVHDKFSNAHEQEIRINARKGMLKCKTNTILF